MKNNFNHYCIYTINKSKFISYFFNINDFKAIEAILKELKLEHKKASHICYAYKFYDTSNICHLKAFDDNEPKGTAGYPILNLIEKKQLNNCILIVVRYFGGIKLGKGNLLRSYLKSANLILNELYNK